MKERKMTNIDIRDKGKSEVYKCESEPIDQTPPTDNLKGNAPQGYFFKNQT